MEWGSAKAEILVRGRNVSKYVVVVVVVGMMMAMVMTTPMVLVTAPPSTHELGALIKDLPSCLTVSLLHYFTLQVHETWLSKYTTSSSKVRPWDIPSVSCVVVRGQALQSDTLGIKPQCGNTLSSVTLGRLAHLSELLLSHLQGWDNIIHLHRRAAERTETVPTEQSVVLFLLRTLGHNRGLINT